MRRFPFPCAGLALCAIAACAQAHAADNDGRAERARAAFEQRFQDADANGDGTIDRAEAQAHLPRVVQRFDRIDANHDGKLTPDEFRAALAQARRAQATADAPAP